MRNIDLNQSFNKLKTEIMKQANDDFAKQFHDQVINITKASAYDILKVEYKRLQEENKRQKETIDAIMDQILNMDIPEVAKNPSILVGAINKVYRDSLNLKNETV